MSDHEATRAQVEDGLDRVELLWVIKSALERAADPRIKGLSVDNDHRSGELFIDVGDGISYVIRTGSVQVVDEDGEGVR